MGSWIKEFSFLLIHFCSNSPRSKHQGDYCLLRSDSLSNLNRHGHYDRPILLLLLVVFIAPATLEIAFELSGIAWRWRR